MVPRAQATIQSLCDQRARLERFARPLAAEVAASVSAYQKAMG